MAAPYSGVSQETPEYVRPNILFYIADDASYAHFGANGCPWVHTPAFDRVAAEGVRFENCYTPNAKSAPSRAVLLTGRYSWQLEEAGNHVTNFPARYKTFVEALADGGYAVGFTGKGWGPGNPGTTADGKPRRLTGKPYQKHKLQPPTEAISPIDYASNFSDFLDDCAVAEAKGEKTPWFFWAGSREPHRRYAYGSGVELGGKTTDMIDRVPVYWPDNEVVRNDLLDYGYEIEYFDSHLARMLADLEQRGELENTLVIVTSDNGMPFPRAKANQYESSHHLPLAMMWGKGIAHRGRVVTDCVNFVDIAPTILDMAGISLSDSGLQPVSGESLRGILLSGAQGRIEPHRNRVILGRERDDYGRPQNQGYPIRAILRDSVLYIWNLKPELWPACDPECGYCEIDGSPTKQEVLRLWRQGINDYYYEMAMGKRPAEELYDLKADPDCVTNLAGNPAWAAEQASLREELLKVLTVQEDPRITGNGDIFDSYPYDAEEKWNFYERVVSGAVREPWKQTGWIDPEDYDAYLKLQQPESVPAR